MCSWFYFLIYLKRCKKNSVSGLTRIKLPRRAVYIPSRILKLERFVIVTMRTPALLTYMYY